MVCKLAHILSLLLFQFKIVKLKIIVLLKKNVILIIVIQIDTHMELFIIEIFEC